jgi:hypothetical protein
LLRELIYTSRAIGYDTIYLPSKEFVYQPTSGNLSPSLTQFTYDKWYDDSFQIRQRTTIQSAITSAENGSGAANTFTEIFDSFGRRTWLKDEGGYMTAFVTDPTSGTLTRRIDDVNTSILVAPNGWTTPPGGGLHLVSELQLDEFGNQSQRLEPLHQTARDGVSTAKNSRLRSATRRARGKSSMKQARILREEHSA